MSSTSTTSPTTPVAPPAPTFNSIFQSPGGPPLILVCIAAGLLLGAFLGILLMRRMRPTVAVQGTPGLRGFPDPQKTLGEKPRLLDVHIVPRSDSANMVWTGAGAGGERGPWGGVLPFAALYLPSPETSATAAPFPSPARTEIWRRQVLALIPGRLRPSRRSHDPHASHKSAAGTGTSSVRAVQLAVTVSMPSPHPLFASSWSTRVGKEKGQFNEHEKDPLSVNSVHDRTDPPDDAPAPAPTVRDHMQLLAANDSEPPVPDCCIGTLVVSYRPPPGPVEPEKTTSVP
ncbi:hypothetical protein OH76DRAFT_1417129 [Lentinus brumalis]|uniref:Uncharacterized protein n=1 Tax=Lentinus brumalis TaxID=2498619 RepID=A0A371DGZ6_9APHY|nr:hypothetical protein OH76DRAFT_1417129 [Polyporus brumalis]